MKGRIERRRCYEAHGRPFKRRRPDLQVLLLHHITLAFCSIDMSSQTSRPSREATEERYKEAMISSNNATTTEGRELGEASPLGETRFRLSAFNVDLDAADMTLLTDGSVGPVFKWPCRTEEEVDGLVHRIMINSLNTKIPTTLNHAYNLARYVGYDDVSGLWWIIAVAIQILTIRFIFGKIPHDMPTRTIVLFLTALASISTLGRARENSKEGPLVRQSILVARRARGFVTNREFWCIRKPIPAWRPVSTEDTSFSIPFSALTCATRLQALHDTVCMRRAYLRLCQERW
jgi:hypothetical protein